MNDTGSTGHTDDDTSLVEGRTEAGLLRVFTRVAHGEHLHSHGRAQWAQHPTHFTRRRPAAVPDAFARRARGTTARKVIWS